MRTYSRPNISVWSETILLTNHYSVNLPNKLILSLWYPWCVCSRVYQYLCRVLKVNGCAFSQTVFATPCPPPPPGVMLARGTSDKITSSICKAAQPWFQRMNAYKYVLGLGKGGRVLEKKLPPVVSMTNG